MRKDFLKEGVASLFINSQRIENGEHFWFTAIIEKQFTEIWEKYKTKNITSIYLMIGSKACHVFIIFSELSAIWENECERKSITFAIKMSIANKLTPAYTENANNFL